MLRTEEDAKKLWCRHTRHGIGTQGVGINRYHQDTNPAWARCIGSACMSFEFPRPWLASNQPTPPSEEWKGYCLADWPGGHPDE